MRFSKLLEEETLPAYCALDFYPVRIGEIFKFKYRVLGKLGFGSSSTVWLCRDNALDRYVTLKVYYNRLDHVKNDANHEVQIYKRLSVGSSSHPGRSYVRTILDHFEIYGSQGQRHQCLVHKPLWNSLFAFQRRHPTRRLTEDVLRGVLIRLFQALDYIHTDCQIIHTGAEFMCSLNQEASGCIFGAEVPNALLTCSIDIKASNILLGIEDQSILEDFEEAEKRDPSSIKACEDRTIYRSRQLGRPKTYGYPVLCDFGEARIGNTEHDDDIQPEVYRAPEVILEMKWTYSVDIWNVGVLIWDLFENQHLFNGMDAEHQEYSNRHHLAEMMALMGPPPVDFLRRSAICSEYFCEQGKWNNQVKIPNTANLEDCETNLGGNNKKLFLRFMRSMLKWVPEERLTARQLLEDPWLKGKIEN